MQTRNATDDVATSVVNNSIAYFSGLPELLQKCPPGAERYVGSLALNIGNFIQWMTPALHIYNADKMHALAQGTLEVARKLYNTPAQPKPQSLSEACLTESRLVALESLTAELGKRMVAFDLLLSSKGNGGQQ